MKSFDDIFNEAVNAGEIEFAQNAPAQKPIALSLSDIDARPLPEQKQDLTPQILTNGMSFESRSPDQVARDNKIIEKTGLPEQAFKVMTPERSQVVRTLGDTPENFVKEFPLSAKALSNPHTMALAKDDIQSLQTLETVLGSLEPKEGDDGYGSDLDDNAGIDYFEGLRDFGQGLDKRAGAVITGLTAAAPAVAEGFDGLILAGMDTLMGALNIQGPTAQAMRAKIEAWRKTNADIKNNLTKEAQDAFDSEIAKLAVSGVVSGGQNLLTLGTAAALSVAGAPITVGTMALGMMGLAAMGASYGEAKDEGLNTAMSLLHGVANGSLEVATEKLGLDSFIKMGKASGLREMLRLGKNYLLGEHAGEQINTFLGDLESWMLIDSNKGKTFEDYLNERGRRVFETAVITTVGGGVQIGGAVAVNTALRASQEIVAEETVDLQKKQAAGIRSQELLNTITELTNNSKIALRTPESMPKLVAGMIGEKVPYAYLPADVLHQSGMEDLLLQSAPELAEEIASAKKSGADIQIPIETMARMTQNEAVNKAVSQEIKFSPDELNAREAQERTASLSADVEARLEQEMKAANPTRAEEIQKIASNISEQLIATGMRREEAHANGQIHAAFFNAMSTLMGVSPAILAQKYGINVARGVNEAAPLSAPAVAPVTAPAVTAVKPVVSKGGAIESGADLQNRDRGKGSSIVQMRNIAANLQYGLVGPGHNLGNDAPIVSYGSIPESQLGAEDYVIAGKGTQKIPVRYAVMDASEIQTSNDPSTGAWNENYGNKELVNAVIGNGRLSAMKLAYAENLAEGYKADFSADTNHGIDPAVIASVKNPVLVRVIDPKYVDKGLIDESNNSSVQRMSPAEVAKNDARVLDLESLRFNADGTPTSESVSNFVKWLDPNEAAGLIDGTGQVTRQAVDRLNATIFAKAYQDDRLVSMYAEAEDPESRLIISALARLAPQAARLEGKGDLDIRSALIDAVNQILQGRKKLYRLSDIAKQTDMFADPDMALFIELFALNPRSTRAAVDILWNAMKEAADSADNIDTATEALFDDIPPEEPMSRAELMNLIRIDLEQAKTDKESLHQGPQERLDLLNKSREFDEQLKQWEQGKGKNKFNLGSPSWVLQLFGVPKTHPISTTKRQMVHVLLPARKTLLGLAGKHGIKPEEIRGILVGIQRPIAVFKSATEKNSLVLLTELTRNNEQIVAPILVKKEINGGFKVVNFLPSIHERRESQIENWINKRLLLGYEKTKGAKLLSNYHQFNSGRHVRDSVTESKPSDKGLTPSAASIIYQNDTSIGDLYQNSNSLRGAYSPSQRLITLFQSSDASTFIHESGHFFLDVMTDLANQPDAPQKLRQDMRTLMSWFGVKSLDEWNAMTLEEKREYHEKFARGFERYMREGKAPSIKLMRIFHSFMNWLKSVYSSVEQLNVKLTPEVREVMDRMLATDQEIRTAKAALGLANTYFTREQFPGTDEEWHEWEAKIKDEDDFSKARLTAQVLGERAFLEKKTADYQARFADEDKAWQEAYNLYYKEAMDTIKEDPLYKMRKRMLEEKYDGKPIYSILRSDVQFLPAEQVEALERMGVLSDSGYPLDNVARQFGYEKQTDFVRDLIFVEPLTPETVADGTARAKVKEEFGNRMTPDKIRELAQKSALNDLAIERLSKEIALLNAGKRDPIILQAAKVWAEETISVKKIRDIKPNQYRQAMQKYQRQYERALAKGDAAAAKEAKKNQLFNAAAMKEAADVEDRVEKLFKEVRRMGIRYRKVLRREQDAGYLDQILCLAGKYGIRDEHKPRESFASFAESMEEQGFPMGLVDSELFDDANTKDYKELTGEEFMNLETAFSVLMFHGHNLRTRTLFAQKSRVKALAKQAVEDMMLGKKADRARKVGPENSWAVALNNFFLSHRKFSSLMREMGGLRDNTVMMEIVARLNHCGDKETYMQTQAGQKLVELLDSIKSTKLTSKVFIEGLGEKMTRAEMISVALNCGNKINKERLSFSVKESAQDEILGKLTKEELDFVQNVWDFLESYWPEMEQLEKRTNGISPRKVEAKPLQVRSVDGFDVTLKGGYYPIVYDPTGSVVSAEQQIKDLGTDMIRGSVQSSTTKQGHMMSRSKKVNRGLLLDLSVIGRHLQQVTHDICFREWVQETNRVFRNKDFKEAVAQNFGVGYYRALSDHLVAIAAGGSAMVNPALEGMASKGANLLKGNVSFNAMALSVTTAALQPLGITQSIQRVGAKWVFAAGLKMAINPYGAFKECHEKSLMMRQRADVLNADIADFNALTRKGKLGKVGRAYEKAAFAPMQYMQMLVDVPTWQAAYQKALSEGYEENRAIEIADQAVLDSQGGGHNKDRSLIHRNHPFATMFYSYFSSMENLWAESLSQQQMKTIKGQVGFLRDFTLLLAIPSLGQALIFSALRGDDWDKEPEEWLKWVFGSIGGTALGMFVWMREFSTLFSGFEYSGPPVARIINDAYRAARTIGSEKAESDSKVMAVLGLVADCVKIPFTQIRRSYSGWKAYIEGDTDMPTSILFGKPQD